MKVVGKTKFKLILLLIIFLLLIPTAIFLTKTRFKVENLDSEKDSYLVKKIDNNILGSEKMAVEDKHSYEIDSEVVFSQDNEPPKEVPKDEINTVLMVGDIMLGRSVNSIMTRKNNYRWPFLNVAEMLREADVTVANLESPLFADCPITDEGMLLCGTEKNVEGLVYSGVDIVSLANNHVGDFGEEAFIETKEILKDNEIKITGLGSPIYKQLGDKVVAFISYNDIYPYRDYISRPGKDVLTKDIKEAKSKSDFVIVSFHWGEEYTEKPSEYQRDLAHSTVDLGADLIVSHHPHWIQSVEKYKDSLIFYSLGNFVFDQMWSQKTREGIAVKFYFYQGEIVDVDLIPVIIENYGQPRIASEAEKELMLFQLEKASYFED